MTPQQPPNLAKAKMEMVLTPAEANFLIDETWR